MLTIKDVNVLRDIIKLIKGREVIKRIVEKDEYDYLHLCVMNEVDTQITFYKSQELSYELQLDLLANGFYKGVFNIGDKYVAKVFVNEGYKNAHTEVLLYKYIERKCPELLQMLCPIVAYDKHFVIMEKAVPCNQKDTIKNYHIDLILKKFKLHGIVFNDLAIRKENFGIVNGKIVIIDYDSWSLVHENSSNDKVESFIIK